METLGTPAEAVYQRIKRNCAQANAQVQPFVVRSLENVLVQRDSSWSIPSIPPIKPASVLIIRSPSTTAPAVFESLVRVSMKLSISLNVTFVSGNDNQTTDRTWFLLNMLNQTSSQARALVLLSENVSASLESKVMECFV